MGPLAGIKIVELAGIGPGPCAGMMLADMGAQVTLIERKDPNKNAAMALETLTEKHTLYNRGKKSIALDLKNPSATELVLRLVAEADFLIEGFRPEVMERLGLVYGRMTGWGQTGPLVKAAGHDPNYIALSGALVRRRQRSRANDPPGPGRRCRRWHHGTAVRPPQCLYPRAENW